MIEHFRSPRIGAGASAQADQAGRAAVCGVPESGGGGDGPKPFHFAHIHNFTPETLSTMARRSGFEVEHWFAEPHCADLASLAAANGATEL